MCELVARQSVIKELERNKNVLFGEDWKLTLAKAIIKDLPSARFTAIHCVDCKYYNTVFFACEAWSKYGLIQTIPDGFCYKAERRQNDE